MLEPKGIITALITPMTDSGLINEKELRNQVNRLIKAGIHGLFCLGTNGEFYALSFEEKLRILSIVLDETKKRIPVFAGTGCITTAETIALSKEAFNLGVDGISVITPYFVEVQQEELFFHYKEIASCIDLPIILYNIPKRTGNHLHHDTVSRLSKIDNIIGIKDTSGVFDNILRYINETDSRFCVLSGSDSLILHTLLAGGVGGISGLSNLFPETLVKIYDSWLKGDIKNAEKLQKSLNPIRDTLSMGNPNSLIKKAAYLLGYPVGPARSPAIGLVEGVDEILKKALEKCEKLMVEN